MRAVPPPAPLPRNRRLSAENRRGQIMQAALGLFIERGFEGVSMGDIAQALGTSRPTVYTYFTSPEAILDALFAERLAQLPARLAPYLHTKPAAVDINGTGPFAAGSPLAFGDLFLALLQERELLMLLGSGGGPRFRERRNAFLSAIEDRLNLRELGRASSAARGHSPQPLLLPIILNLLTGMAYEQITQTNPQNLSAQTLSTVLEQFIEGGINGLLAQQNSQQSR